MFLNKRVLTAVAGLAGISALALHANPAQSAQATANANATIIAAITITKTLDLEFGSIVAGSVSSVVRVATNDSRSVVSGDATLAGAANQAASFDVTGEPSLTYAITLPASTTISGPGTDMTVDTFTDSNSGTGTLDGTGNDTFTVGADLTVGASQTAGSYTGTFDVTVNYN